MPDFKEHIPEENRLNLRSEEVHEILSHIPNWIIRWGITAIFGTLLLLLIASWFIKYPEIIPSRAIITTPFPPSPIVARASGKIEHFFVSHNDIVKKNEYLAVLENTGNINEIIKVRKLIQSFLPFFSNPDSVFHLREYQNLGELQLEYSSFLVSYNDFRYFMENNYYKKRMKQIERQISVLKQLKRNTTTQSEILEKEHKIALKKYKTDQQLFKKQLISEIELSQSEGHYLSAKSTLESGKSSLLNNQLQLIEYNKTLADISNQYRDQRKTQLNLVRSTYKQLKSKFELFEHTYILKSPTNGIASFLGFWSQNQYLKSGETIMFVVSGGTSIIGKINLTTMGAGKVKVGQTVKVKLDQYKFNEFGVLIGKIKSISLVPNQNTYVVDVEFPNGLKTSYNKTLDYKPEMQGLAEIVTEDLRLLERIFNQLRSLLKNNM
jgi:HlyD family secretion protein